MSTGRSLNSRSTVAVEAPLVAKRDYQQLEFSDNEALRDLCGVCDAHLTALEQAFNVSVVRNDNRLLVYGEQAREAIKLLRLLRARIEQKEKLDIHMVELAIKNNSKNSLLCEEESLKRHRLRTPQRCLYPRTQTQADYLQALREKSLTFAVGPAGTGKTYLAVAAAVAQLQSNLVDRIILSRPAVEAGERLGFLPGDLREKIDPYLRPLFDSLHDFLPAERVRQYLENGRIEIAPLAYMRGRTLSNAFLLLDEAQNCTDRQMRMFLTRLGANTHIAVTGDLTQIDLPAQETTGLATARHILQSEEAVALIEFDVSDSQRHPLVQRIISAYSRADRDK